MKSAISFALGAASTAIMAITMALTIFPNPRTDYANAWQNPDPVNEVLCDIVYPKYHK